MYVSEICTERIFVTFPWWLKNVKSRSKIAHFSNERHFEIWFPKKRTITFFWSKLSKLHKKDPILHVTTTFSLKQGETKTSHGPIPHPLILVSTQDVIILLSGAHICKSSTCSMHQYWKSFHPILLIAASLPSFLCSLLAPVSCFDHHLVRYVTHREKWNIIHPPLPDPC